MAIHAYSTHAPTVRAFSTIAEILAAASLIAGGSVLIAFATLL